MFPAPGRGLLWCWEGGVLPALAELRSVGTADGCAQLERTSGDAATSVSQGPERAGSGMVGAARLCGPQCLPDVRGLQGSQEHPLS